MIETQEEYAKTWALINGQDRQVAKDFHATIEALRKVARALPHDIAEELSYDLDMTRKMFKITPGGDTDRRLARFVKALNAHVDALANLSDWLTDG